MKVTSFGDSTKPVDETTFLPSTGFPSVRRGMYGLAAKTYERWRGSGHDQMLETGLVDYAIGGPPAAGAVLLFMRFTAEEGRLAY